MKPLALLLVALAVPAAAQVVPDEFPDPTEPFADRVERQLVERHRAFLSGLYASSSATVGPEISQPGLLGGFVAEGGYRFGSGHAVALQVALRRPLDGDPLRERPTADATGSFGVQYVVGLGRRAAPSSPFRQAEVALGVAASVFDDAAGGELVTVPSVDVTPRVAIPLTPVLSAPVGVRLSQELGPHARSGLFVGLSIGLRRIWADEARMVLE